MEAEQVVGGPETSTEAHEIALDNVSANAARVFLRRLAGNFEPSRALVFGSRARGTHGPQSDLDLAVILPGSPGDRWAAARAMARLAFDVLMETDVLIDALPLWEPEMAEPDRFRNPALMHAILRDGTPA